MQNKLLLVHDSRATRESIRTLVADAGLGDWGIREATSEPEAYRLIDREEFQLAVVDLRLDESTESKGLKVIKHLRTRQPVCRIIGITAADDVIGSGVKMLQAGAHDFISETWSRWQQDLRRRLELWGGVIGDPVPSLA
jgi:DNA-binding NtrC family response regulator